MCNTKRLKQCGTCALWFTCLVSDMIEPNDKPCPEEPED